MNRRHFFYASGGLTVSPLISKAPKAPQTPVKTETTEAAKDVTRERPARPVPAG